jgi:hypothetical protein
MDFRRAGAEPQGLDESLSEVALNGGDQEAQSAGTFHVGTPLEAGLQEQLRGHGLLSSTGEEDPS